MEGLLAGRLGAEVGPRLRIRHGLTGGIRREADAGQAQLLHFFHHSAGYHQAADRPRFHKELEVAQFGAIIMRFDDKIFPHKNALLFIHDVQCFPKIRY